MKWIKLKDRDFDHEYHISTTGKVKSFARSTNSRGTILVNRYGYTNSTPRYDLKYKGKRVTITITKLLYMVKTGSKYRDLIDSSKNFIIRKKDFNKPYHINNIKKYKYTKLSVSKIKKLRKYYNTYQISIVDLAKQENIEVTRLGKILRYETYHRI